MPKTVNADDLAKRLLAPHRRGNHVSCGAGELRRAIADLLRVAVADEREACAKVAEAWGAQSVAAADAALEKGDVNEHQAHTLGACIAGYIATAIRTRKD